MIFWTFFTFCLHRYIEFQLVSTPPSYWHSGCEIVVLTRALIRVQKTRYQRFCRGGGGCQKLVIKWTPCQKFIFYIRTAEEKKILVKILKTRCYWPFYNTARPENDLNVFSECFCLFNKSKTHVKAWVYGWLVWEELYYKCHKWLRLFNPTF